MSETGRVAIPRGSVRAKAAAPALSIPDHPRLRPGNLLRLIGSGWDAEGDAQPVPAVDRDDRHRQVDQLLFREVPACFLVDFVRDLARRYQRDRFGPAEGRPLAVAVEGRLAPGVQLDQPLYCLARRPGVLRVHVEAVSAAVDLGGAHLDQL